MPDSKLILQQYRLASANERINSSKILFENGQYKDSIGRSYYAMFTAARALLAGDGVDFSKHTGVIGYFQKNYIKEQKLDKKYSKYISEAFQIRNNVDYADFFMVSKEDAQNQLQRAEEFVSAIKQYLHSQVGGSN